MKICFVVHRYAPYPGGSEYYVQWMAEECLRRGHEVTVFTGEHQGDLNGVRVTSDSSIFAKPLDLIVVHGGDVGVQDAVLRAIPTLPSPVLYLLIKPSASPVCLEALAQAKYIGCSTLEDWEHVELYGAKDRAVSVRHGIHLARRLGVRGRFREKYGIPMKTPLFLSCGGYWPNKRMKELAETFEAANPDEAVLVITGYDNRMNLMPENSRHVIPMMLEDEQDVANALADADVYIMNSSEEGFGLVLLECMANHTPWIARDIAGARLLRDHGTIYQTEEDLLLLLPAYRMNVKKLEAAYKYVLGNHLIQHTIDDICGILQKD